MMCQEPLGSPLPKQIAVFRALQLGDLLCAVPAWRALRAALPDVRVTLIGLPWARSFVERFSAYLDDFLEFPGFPGLPEQKPNLAAIPVFLADAQRRRFDLALQMHGDGLISNPIAVLLGARVNAGFFVPGQYSPDPDRFFPYPAELPEVRRNLRLVECIGIPPQGEHLEFPLGKEDENALQTIDGIQKLAPGRYVCIHPGAREVNRRWPVACFAEVADAIADDGLHVAITGSAEEFDVAKQVARTMRAPSFNLAGRTKLGGLAALLRRARLLVANDTGVSHLAAALSVPSVIVFTGSEPHRWAPLDHRRHRAVFMRAAPTVRAVLKEVSDLLQNEVSCVA